MSELVDIADRRNLRRQLLMTASAFALLASAVTQALAEDADRPAIWIELGGQFDFMSNPTQTWLPPNLPAPIDHPVTGILGERPRIGYDWEGKFTFQPAATDWEFSVGIRYGKAKRGPKYAHDQTYNTKFNGNKYVPTTYAFTDMHSVEETQHLILDFQAGKDIGLGILGGHGNSTINFGIRFAQFRAKADSRMTAQVSAPYKYPVFYSYPTRFHSADMHSQRSFRGIGPSISWNGSVPVTGSLEDGLAVDWGANAAILFGRQKAKVRTHTREFINTGQIYYPTPHLATAVVTNSTVSSVRNRAVVVPNIGAFAGVSYRVGGRGKIALGYRADFFFGAMDGGIDARKSTTTGFHGPFAAISLGLGG